jgi:hypothetical protein
MKIKNTFQKGILNTDYDYRFLENGTLIDAENFLVTVANGSNIGVGNNVLGTVLTVDNEFLGGISYGTGKDSANNKVYYFVKATNYDYLMEYDIITNDNVVVLQSTTGTRLNLKSGERITNIDIYIDPEGNGNLIQWSGDTNPPRIGNIERMKTWGIDGFTAEEIMLIKAPPIYSPTLTPIISTENAQANYLENKIICFATRFKYKDGYYSAISSWSKYFFEPKAYNLDFETFENLGMLNSFNSVNISFNTGLREVVAIDLLFKFSNETNIYKVDTFIKEDEGWADDTIQTLEFNNSKVYGILPADQYFRSFDNVPEIALAQSPIGNRVAFANYKEGKNLIDKNGNKVIMDYTLALVSNEIETTFLDVDQNSINYTFDAVPITLPKGQIIIDASGLSFKNGNSIIFNFKLKSNERLLDFDYEFKFTLFEDYTDLTDLITNSTIQDQLDLLTIYFENNGGVNPPVDYLPPYIVLKGFEISNIGTDIIITFPVIKYEIDETPDPNTFVRDYFYNDLSSASYNSVSVATSLKSLRSYEICMIYRDLQGRKTTALTSTNNTLFIPNENAITQNQIQVNIPLTQKPPTWAKTYKFGIKINQGLYETIPINIFFVDGIYRWIKLDGENKNKVQDGDILIVKSDGTGFLPNPIKVKVLDVKQQPINFITTNPSAIPEPAGLYAKIKALDFEMEYSNNEFSQYSGYAETTNGYPTSFTGDFSELDALGVKIDKPFPQGSQINLSFRSDYKNEDPRILFNRTYTAQQNYANFFDFFYAQINPLGFQSTSHPTKTYLVTLVRGIPIVNPTTGLIILVSPDPAGFLYLVVQGTESGTGSGSASRYGRVYVTATIRTVSNLFIFEKTAKEIDNDIFYETPEIYDVIDGEHEMEEHLLVDTYNCFCQGNGVESFQIRDAFNEKTLAIDFCPTAVSEDEYRQVDRYADITYSGVYNSTTNINRLNEFNLSKANFKDDIEKSYGSIIKIRGKDTDLEVYQEDKVSIVYYGKDLLSNVDGSTNLVSIEDVLGKQNTYQEENGISTHPESFDFEAINRYFTDVKGGTVCKLSNNGIFEITTQGMKNYFRKLFKENTINNIIGQYDQFNDYFILNIKYNNTEYQTWIYSDSDDGWLGRIKFNPDDMIRINNELIAFKNGNVYKCNQSKNGLLDNYNTFFGIEYPSKFKFAINEGSSTRKNFKTLSIEGTDAWQTKLKTDINEGYINKEDYEKKEGVFYAYVRTDNDVIDTAIIGANQGIGNCTISGLTLNFDFDLNGIVNVGDEIRNADLELVGSVLSKNTNSLTLNSVLNIVSGDFVICSKPQSIENNNLLGYAMEVEMTLSKNSKASVFAVNSEAQKSFE